MVLTASLPTLAMMCYGLSSRNIGLGEMGHFGEEASNSFFSAVPSRDDMTFLLQVVDSRPLGCIEDDSQSSVYVAQPVRERNDAQHVVIQEKTDEVDVKCLLHLKACVPF